MNREQTKEEEEEDLGMNMQTKNIHGQVVDTTGLEGKPRHSSPQ